MKDNRVLISMKVTHPDQQDEYVLMRVDEEQYLHYVRFFEGKPQKVEYVEVVG